MTQSGGFLRVRNWERYQHYKTGPMSEAERKASGKGPLPWVEFHTSILNDFKLMSLPLEVQAIAFKLLQLARLKFNEVPAELDALAFGLRIETPKDRATLKKALPMLVEIGWIEGDDLPSRQPSRQDDATVLTHNKTDITRQEEWSSDDDPTLDLVSFDEAWKPWPKKVAKKEAKKAFNKQPERIRSREFHEKTIWPALREQVRAPKWAKDGIFCHFATWYNGARWEDVTAKPGGEAREAIGLRGFDYVEVRNRSLAERQSLRPVAVPALHENRPGEADAGAGGDGAGEAPEHVPEVGNGSAGGNRDPTDAGEVVVR